MNSKTHISLPSADAFRRVDSSIWNFRFAVGAVSLVGGIVLLWLSFVEMNLAYSSFGPAAVPGWGRARLAQAGALLLLAAVILASIALRRKFGLVINKEGLTFYRPIFSEVFVPWKSVRGVAFSQDQSTVVSNWRNHRAVLWLEEHQRVSINKYIHPRDLPEIVTRIKAELYPQLEVRFRNSLNAGRDVSFGALGLSKNGLIWNEKLHPWDQIKHIYLDKGVLRVEMADAKAFRQSILNIPNLEVLILLIREIEYS